LANLLIECSFLLLLTIVACLILMRKLKKPFFASTPERVGRLSLRDFELIDCNLPLAEDFGFLNCHDCLQIGVEIVFDQNMIIHGPTICQVNIDGDFVKTAEMRVLALVEGQFLDFMIIGEPKQFDLFTQLPLPLIKLDKRLVIDDLNLSANQVFGSNKKGLPVSTLVVPSFRNRIATILLTRSRRHKTFSLSVPVVSANAEVFVQKWRIAAISPEELILACFPIEINREEKWLFFEQVYPGQSVSWELDLSSLTIRHNDVGLAWQQNFNLTNRASFIAWLGMVHPQDRNRVRREFELFFLHPESPLNSTYRMASIQGLELTVTSIGSHAKGKLTKGIHQIIESHSFHDDEESLFNQRSSSEFSALCHSMGLRAKWINRESKTLFPVDLDLRNIIFSIIGDNKDTREVCVETFQPSNQKVHCTSCGEGIHGGRVTLTIRIPNLNLPPQHINQILRYGYHTQALLVDDSTKLGKELGESLGVQEQIHLLGGHLTVMASNGSMIFVIFLPIKETSDVSNAAVKDRFPDVPTESNPSVQSLLIIDDQEMVLSYLSETLRLEGYHVTGFSSSAEALRDFESDPFKYDFVITDQNMDGLSGTEIISSMLAIRPELPIVLCSGQSLPIGEQNASALGAMAFFRKPLDMQKLVSLCRSRLSRAGQKK